MNAFHAFCRQSLDSIRAQGRYRTFTPLAKQAEGFPYYRDPDGKMVLVWSSNDYLAMGGHPALVEAACEAARTMGVGAGGTRNISGTSPLIDALERELADLHGKQAGLLFTSGFVSNQAALSTVLNSLPNGPDERWQVFSDAKNHASMIAGIKGSRAIVNIFRHNDMNHLEALLKADSGVKLITREFTIEPAESSPIAGRAALALWESPHFVVVQHGWGGGGFARRRAARHKKIACSAPKCVLRFALSA